jgi:hypothetical protein
MLVQEKALEDAERQSRATAVRPTRSPPGERQGARDQSQTSEDRGKNVKLPSIGVTGKKPRSAEIFFGTALQKL